jgi:hypothetical protein
MREPQNLCGNLKLAGGQWGAMRGPHAVHLWPMKGKMSVRADNVCTAPRA